MSLSSIIGEGAASDSLIGSRISAKGGVGILGFQIVSTSLDAADAVFKIQQTNYPEDPTSWIDTPAATLTIASGTDVNVIALDVLKLGSSYFRFNYDAGANTTGTIKVIV